MVLVEAGAAACKSRTAQIWVAYTVKTRRISHFFVFDYIINLKNNALPVLYLNYFI